MGDFYAFYYVKIVGIKRNMSSEIDTLAEMGFPRNRA